MIVSAIQGTLGVGSRVAVFSNTSITSLTFVEPTFAGQNGRWVFRGAVYPDTLDPVLYLCSRFDWMNVVAMRVEVCPATRADHEAVGQEYVVVYS